MDRRQRSARQAALPIDVALGGEKVSDAVRCFERVAQQSADVIGVFVERFVGIDTRKRAQDGRRRMAEIVRQDALCLDRFGHHLDVCF